MKPFPLIATCLLLLPLSAAAQTSDSASPSGLAEQCNDSDAEMPYPERAAICAEALAATQDPQERADLLISRGAAARLAEEFAAAEADLLEALPLVPNSIRPYINLSYTHYDQGNLGLAMNWALRATEIDPANPIAYEPLLYLHVLAPDPVENCPATTDRILQYLPALDLNGWSVLPNDMQYLIGDIGICLAWQDRNEEALIAYRAAEAIGLDEDYNRSNMALAAYLSAQDDFAQATALDALGRDDPHIDLILSLAGSYAYTGQFAAAVDVLDEYSDFLAGQDDDAGVYNVVGWQAFLADEHEITQRVMLEWINWFTALETPPYAAGHMWDTIAQNRTAMGDVEGAIIAFALSIEQMDPPSDQIAFLRHTLEELGYAPGPEHEELMATLRECVETGPECRLVAADGWDWPSLQ